MPPGKNCCPTHSHARRDAEREDLVSLSNRLSPTSNYMEVAHVTGKQLGMLAAGGSAAERLAGIVVQFESEFNARETGLADKALVLAVAIARKSKYWGNRLAIPTTLYGCIN